MPDLYRFTDTFAPILLEGMTARIFGSNIDPAGLNVKCVAVMALPEYEKDFGALTAATWSSDNEDTNLEMNDNELSQVRMRVIDDMIVRLKHPSSVQQWRTRSTNFYLPQYPQGDNEDFLKQYYFKASEFFVWEHDATPRFDCYSAITTVKSRIIFNGWKFKMQRIAVQGRIDLWVNGWPSGKQAIA